MSNERANAATLRQAQGDTFPTADAATLRSFDDAPDKLTSRLRRGMQGDTLKSAETYLFYLTLRTIIINTI